MIPARRIRIAITVMIVVGTIGLCSLLWSQNGTEGAGLTVLTNLVIVSFFGYYIYVVWKIFR